MTSSMASYSAVGRRRNNEDSLYVGLDDARIVVIVADGLGGHANGEYASREAAEVIPRLLTGHPLSEDLLEDAVLSAHEAVLALHAQQKDALTTVAVLWTDGKTALAAHVGDSRIYQLRGDQILYQSTDHSMSQLAVMAGDIRPEQIRGHKDRNKLIRVVGGQQEPRVDIHELRAEPGDRFLLCSDGFWEQVTEPTMLRLAAGSPDAEAWLAAMRAIAEPAASDNNTAVAVVLGDPTPGDEI